jgi:hypothetical protein
MNYIGNGASKPHGKSLLLSLFLFPLPPNKITLLLCCWVLLVLVSLYYRTAVLHNMRIFFTLFLLVDELVLVSSVPFREKIYWSRSRSQQYGMQKT